MSLFTGRFSELTLLEEVSRRHDAPPRIAHIFSAKIDDPGELDGDIGRGGIRLVARSGILTAFHPQIGKAKKNL
ncbi:hypothetical protein RMSM_00656 [Rhodopirellula maiorica SM1]|uniref:Uncharacterized protein n=1 Tax=Rhodopirellula maiorica SM1 TaxID=1265738 RepID=M5S8D4_9BACT|nr:hypothetical protein RMSM_00656 [Rhodopirellula maiorica SM1]